MRDALRFAVAITLPLLVLGPSTRGEVLLFYDFNDVSTGKAIDTSGNGNDGSLKLAQFTEDEGGRTGMAGDFAVDLLGDQDSAYVDVPTARGGAFDSLTANDAATITLWAFGGENQPQNNIGFWFGPNRQLSSHIPWGNGRIFFDVGGFSQRISAPLPQELYRDVWTHYAFVKDQEDTRIYVNGDLFLESEFPINPIGSIFEASFGSGEGPGQFSYNGLMDDIGVWDEALTQETIRKVMDDGFFTPPELQAGDADQDLDFDQLDLVKVQISAKYLTGAAATWGEGDWNAAPGGRQGAPPEGDGLFNQLDIVAALSNPVYLTGPYAAIQAGGASADNQTSLVYDPKTGELSVDAPTGNELTSINVTSAGGLFLGDKPAVLDGAFDNFAADNIFKATFGGSFGSITFGTVLPTNLGSSEVAADLSAVGSLAGGGDLGDVDLVYLPEPAGILLIAIGFGLSITSRRHRGLAALKSFD